MSTALNPQQIAAREQHVIAQAPLGLVHVPDAETQAYDATLLNAENPVPVDIKTCQEWLAVTGSNGNRRRGRFFIRRGAHERLVDLGGLYLFGVLDGDGDLLRCEVIAAERVDRRFVDDWTNGGRDDVVQLNWSVVFGPTEGEPDA